MAGTVTMVEDKMADLPESGRGPLVAGNMNG